jgi:hypothetical protein
LAGQRQPEPIFILVNFLRVVFRFCLAAKKRSSASECVALSQNLKKGLDQDLDIKPETPVVDIP